MLDPTKLKPGDTFYGRPDWDARKAAEEHVVISVHDDFVLHRSPWASNTPQVLRSCGYWAYYNTWREALLAAHKHLGQHLMAIEKALLESTTPEPEALTHAQ